MSAIELLQQLLSRYVLPHRASTVGAALLSYAEQHPLASPQWLAQWTDRHPIR